MVDYRKLRELVKLMTENDLSELDLRDQTETVVIKRAVASVPMTQAIPMMGAPMVQHMTTHAGGAASVPPEAPVDDESDLVAIKSPMVGTYYAAPDPNSPAYVAVGAAVSSDTVVCIVEAMKVFSEIKAECAGKIEKVLAKSGDPVEFGQKLFLVRPA